MDLSEEEAAKLTDRIQNAGTEVVEAKVGIVGVVHQGASSCICQGLAFIFAGAVPPAIPVAQCDQ